MPIRVSAVIRLALTRTAWAEIVASHDIYVRVLLAVTMTWTVVGCW